MVLLLVYYITILWSFCNTGLQCGRSKTTAIVKEMSAMAMADLATTMREKPYSLATDGSNEADAKQFPLVVRTFDVTDGQLGCVTTQLLALRDCEGSATGELHATCSLML